MYGMRAVEMGEACVTAHPDTLFDASIWMLGQTPYTLLSPVRAGHQGLSLYSMESVPSTMSCSIREEMEHDSI